MNNENTLIIKENEEEIKKQIKEYASQGF
jgi:hypothetical protein